MIRTVAHISQEAMELHVRPQGDTAIISITNHGKPIAVIPDGFHSVLRLEFDDLYEEYFGEPVGSVPDMCASGPLLRFGEVLPDARHAQQIVDFIRNAELTKCEHIIVHCHAGVSRSAAVAVYIKNQYDAVIDQANNDQSGANRRLLRLLYKVHHGLGVVVGEYDPYLSMKNKDPAYASSLQVGSFF